MWTLKVPLWPRALLTSTQRFAEGVFECLQLHSNMLLLSRLRRPQRCSSPRVLAASPHSSRLFPIIRRAPVWGSASFIYLIQFFTANDSELEGNYREKQNKWLLDENPLDPFEQARRGSLKDAVLSIRDKRWMLFNQHTCPLGMITSFWAVEGLHESLGNQAHNATNNECTCTSHAWLQRTCCWFAC